MWQKLKNIAPDILVELFPDNEDVNFNSTLPIKVLRMWEKALCPSRQSLNARRYLRMIWNRNSKKVKDMVELKYVHFKL